LIDSENWHAKTVDPSEKSKLSSMSIIVIIIISICTKRTNTQKYKTTKENNNGSIQKQLNAKVELSAKI